MKLGFIASIFAFAILAMPHAEAAFKGGSNRLGDAPGFCHLEAQIKVVSWHAGILGESNGKGEGAIVCVNADWSLDVVPVRVTTHSDVALGIGGTVTRGYLYSQGIGAIHGAEDLAGVYGVVKSSAQLGFLGGELGFSATSNEGGFTIPLDMKVNLGFGLEWTPVDLGTMTVTIK